MRNCPKRNATEGVPYSESGGVQYGIERVQYGESKASVWHVEAAALDIAAAEATAFVAEADVAAATILAASFQARAHRIQHVTALAVAAAAGEGAAFFGPLEFALPASEIEAAKLHPVAYAAAGAVATADGIAQAMQIIASQRIIAAATNAKATHELLEREFTSHGVPHIELGPAKSELHLRLFGKLSHCMTGHKSHSTN